MLKAERRQRGCLRKIVYRNVSDAEARASEMRRQVIYNVLEPQVYLCPFGRKTHYHVGHGVKQILVADNNSL